MLFRAPGQADLSGVAAECQEQMTETLRGREPREPGTSAPRAGCRPGSGRAAWPYLQLLALVVELLPVVLQLPHLAVQLADHRVPLLLQLAVPGLLLLQTVLPDLDVFLL